MEKAIMMKSSLVLLVLAIAELFFTLFLGWCGNKCIVEMIGGFYGS